jgi:PAS domain S-box-containing protein
MVDRSIGSRTPIEGPISPGGNDSISDYRAFLESVIETSAEYSIFALNPAGQIQMWNLGAQQSFGYSKEEAVGMDSRALRPESDRGSEMADRQFVSCLELGRWEGLVPQIRKDRGLFTSRVVMTVIRGPTGIALGFLVVSTDISAEEKIHERQLIDSETSSRNLIRTSSEVLGTVTDLNRLIEELNEYPRGTSSGPPFRRFFLAASAAGDEPAPPHSTPLADLTANPRSDSVHGASHDAPANATPTFRDWPEPNRRLSEVSPDGLVTLDDEGWIVDANPQMEKLTAYSREELVGTRFPEYFTHPEAATIGFEKTRREGLVRNLELTLHSRTGLLRLVSLSATVVRNPDAGGNSYLAALRDITQVKKLEAALRESQNYNRVLVESNIDALMTTDVLGRISDVNGQAELLTGLPREELVGTLFKEHFTDPAIAEEAIRRVVAEGRVSDYELTMQTRHGMVNVSYNAMTFRDTNGHLRGVFASARDITEKRRLREELEQRNVELEKQNQLVREASRLKSEFLANMSHELRTPLNSIIGYSDFLATQKGGRFGPKQREYLQDIRNSGNHLLELINDILDLAKVESGRMDLHPEPFSPKQAIAEVCSVVKRMAEEKHLRLRSSVAPRIATVSLDPLRFKQILYNLVSNAVKFTDPDGQIDVRVKPVDPNWFRLEVADTGIGIAPKDFPRLFREFEQLDTGPGRHYEGSGLGLSLTKKLVELHGGTIGVKSQVGRGTTFEIVLPASLPARSAEPSAPTVR